MAECSGHSISEQQVLDSLSDFVCLNKSYTKSTDEVDNVYIVITSNDIPSSAASTSAPSSTSTNKKPNQ